MRTAVMRIAAKTFIGVAFMLGTMLQVSPLWAHDETLHYDRIHLSASASTKVENDTVIATLYAEAEGSKAARLSDEVNKKIRWALAEVEKHSAVKSQTNAYSTNPVYRNNKIWGWRVRQSVRLESRDMVLMSELLGDLQEKLALQGMHFAISPDLSNKTDDELIVKALEYFETRAKRVSQQLGRKSYRIVDININSAGHSVRRQPQMMRAMAMEMDSSPQVEAGEQTIQVTVSGEVELE